MPAILKGTDNTIVTRIQIIGVDTVVLAAGHTYCLASHNRLPDCYIYLSQMSVHGEHSRLPECVLDHYPPTKAILRPERESCCEFFVCRRSGVVGRMCSQHNRAISNRAYRGSAPPLD